MQQSITQQPIQNNAQFSKELSIGSKALAFTQIKTTKKEEIIKELAQSYLPKEEEEKIDECRETLLEKINEKLENESDPVKKKELENGKNILEISQLLHKKKQAISKINDLSFKGNGNVLGSKWKDALGVVQINSAIAGTLAAALAPIPFADVVPLQLNNVAMLMGICSVYQVKVEKAAALNIVATTAASFGGQALFSAVAGMIPGVGSVANATVAVGVTEAIGAAIVGFCELALKNGEKPDFSKFKGDDFKHYTDCLKYLDQRDKNN